MLQLQWKMISFFVLWEKQTHTRKPVCSHCDRRKSVSEMFPFFGSSFRFYLLTPSVGSKIEEI